MKKEVLRLFTKLIEIKTRCGFDISATLAKFKKIPYKNFDIDAIKKQINWFISEHQLEDYEPETLD